MALTNIIKGVPISQVFHRIDVNGVEHLFIENKSGSIVHIIKDQGVCRVVINYKDTNAYFYTAYSQLSNCFYITGGEMIEYDPVSGNKHVYQAFKDGATIYSSWSQFIARYSPIFYNPLMSTDGHVYLGQYPFNNLHGYVRFNVLTKEFDDWSIHPDREFTHIYGRIFNDAFYIDNGALAGVYSSYRWAVEADDYVDLRDTILAEIASAGLTVLDNGVLFLHQDDRELVSATRRIYYNINGGLKIIDIKSPSTWINRPANTDQSGIPVSTTNWITGVKLYDLATQAGLTVPTLNVSLAYCVPQKVGRYVYVGHYYLGAATYFFVFAIHPVTKEAMYTYSFNKYEAFLQNGERIRLCNFGGDYGFSSDDEIVNFLSDNVGNWYFIRPDTHQFVLYNMSTNPNGYIKAVVSLDDISDPNGFGVFFEPRFTSSVVQTINGEDWITNANVASKAALSTEYLQETTGDLTDITYRYLPDKSKPTEVISVQAKGLWSSVGALTQALVTASGKVACIGEVYNGAAFINVVDANNFTLQKYEGRMISPNGAIRVGNYIIAYGYSGTTNVFDVSDWNNIERFNLVTGPTNEVTYMTSRPEGILGLGISSRSAKHHEGCAFSLVDLDARTVIDLAADFPNEFIRNSAINLRSSIGLSGASYTDGAVESAVQAYMTSQVLTRLQVINLFKDTCRWHCADAHTYGDKTVVGLAYEGVLGLSGIRIERVVGSGDWIDQEFYSTEGGKALLIDTTDILNLQPSEIKPVTFNLTPNVQSMGRVAGSTNYLAFIVNDEVSYDGIIRIVSKTDFETAANGSGIITTIPTIVTIDFGGIAGYGFGDADDFDHYDTHCSNAYFCQGDNLYITCRSNINEGGGLYACVIKVDLTTGSSETFVKSATRVTRAISYDGTRMLITNGTSLVINDNFTSQVGSITI